MATGVRVAITLACTECKRRNYQTQKSKRNSPDRVEFNEVLPLVRQAHGAPGDEVAPWHARLAGSAGQPGPPPETGRPPAAGAAGAGAARAAARQAADRAQGRAPRGQFVRECCGRAPEGRLAEPGTDLPGRRRRHHRVHDRGLLSLGPRPAVPPPRRPRPPLGAIVFLWYVINTYSGHENKVKTNLEHRIVSMNQRRRSGGSSSRPSRSSRRRTARRCRPRSACSPATSS